MFATDPWQNFSSLPSSGPHTPVMACSLGGPHWSTTYREHWDIHMKTQRQRTHIEIILWKNRSHLISHCEVQKSEETSLRMTVLIWKLKIFQKNHWWWKSSEINAFCSFYWLKPQATMEFWRDWLYFCRIAITLSLSPPPAPLSLSRWRSTF